MLYLHLASAEDDDSLQVASFEDVLDDVHLLCLVAYVSFLLYLLGRFAYCEFDLYRILEQSLCQFFYFLGHCGREHNGLASFWQFGCDGLDILRESHVEHAVCLIKNKEAYLAEVYIAQADMRDESAWCSYHHVCTHAQAFQFLVVTVSVVSSIYSHAAYALQVISEALHGLVYLLCQLACRRHDNTVDGIRRITTAVEFAEHWQQIGSSFACSGLRNSHYVVAFQYLWNTLFLYWGASVETHIVERIEHVVI